MKIKTSNKDNVSSNIFILSGDAEAVTPYGWDDMPEFVQEDEHPYAEIRVNIRTKEDLIQFAKIMEQDFINEKTKASWFPARDRRRNSLFRWFTKPKTN